MDITTNQLGFNDMAIKYAMEELKPLHCITESLTVIKLNKACLTLIQALSNRGIVAEAFLSMRRLKSTKALTSKPQKQAVWELHTRISLSV